MAAGEEASERDGCTVGSPEVNVILEVGHLLIETPVPVHHRQGGTVITAIKYKPRPPLGRV